jgi:glutamate-1-semialdehyde 2,1-aminomutase
LPGLPEVVDYDTYMRLIDQLHPGRSVGALFIPVALDAQGMAEANRFVATETARDRICRGLFFVKPTDDPEWVRQEVRRSGLHGLKCYHTHSAKQPTWNADIPDYLPESLVRVAHEEGWVITLHVVKSRAMADPANVFWVRRYCERYPGMRLILAHSARGFQPAHNLEGLPQLTGLDNLYFDTSANCEPIAHEAILRIIGPRKLMYGSDLPVSHLRGRSVAAGDSFIWLYENTPVWGEKHLQVKPVLIGLEHLRSLKWACWSAGLSDSQVEAIFWGNAAGLLGIESREAARAAAE